MKTMKSLRYDDVNFGDEVPTLVIPLTRTLIVAKTAVRKNSIHSLLTPLVSLGSVRISRAKASPTLPVRFDCSPKTPTRRPARSPA